MSMRTDDWSFDHPHPDHIPHLTIRRRGGSGVSGIRGHSGSDLRCSCGWKTFTNEGPPSSKAGKGLRANYETHLRDDVLTPPHLVLLDDLMRLDRSHDLFYGREVRAAYRRFSDRTGR